MNKNKVKHFHIKIQLLLNSFSINSNIGLFVSRQSFTLDRFFRITRIGLNSKCNRSILNRPDWPLKDVINSIQCGYGCRIVPQLLQIMTDSVIIKTDYLYHTNRCEHKKDPLVFTRNRPGDDSTICLFLRKKMMVMIKLKIWFDSHAIQVLWLFFKEEHFQKNVTNTRFKS